MKKLSVLLVVLLVTTSLFAACAKQPYQSPAAAETTVAVAEVQATVEDTQAPEVQQPTEAKEKETLPTPSEAAEQTTKKANEAPKTDEQTNADVKVTKEEVKKAVLAHAGLNETDVKFLKVELDRERNGLVYEVEFNSGNYEYDYEVSAENGKVLKAEKEPDKVGKTPSAKPTQSFAQASEVKVSKEEAKAVVLKHANLDAKDVKFVKVELDRERNDLVYEIEFDSGKYEYEYEVSAESGKVLKAEKEFKD